MSLHKNILTLVKYKSWANQITFESLIALPQEEILKNRKTRFKNMAHTLNHVYIIDLVFKAHLQGLKHGYKSRNTENYPEIKNLYKL